MRQKYNEVTEAKFGDLKHAGERRLPKHEAIISANALQADYQNGAS
jgi:hypothetical protein